MLEAYRQHVEERAAEGVPPKPLTAEQVAALIELLKAPPAGEEEFILDLITNRVPPGVDEAAYVKAGFLTAIAKGEATSPLIDKIHAVKLLGTMLGGYNINTLVELLDDDELAEAAAEELKHTLLMFDAFHDVEEKMQAGNANVVDGRDIATHQGSGQDSLSGDRQIGRPCSDHGDSGNRAFFGLTSPVGPDRLRVVFPGDLGHRFL